MKLAMQIDYAGDILKTVELVRVFEEAGLDMVFVAEAYGFDAVSILGYLSAKTNRVALGPGILPIFSRTPALIGQTAAGLDYVSSGRAILGLGASGPQVIEGWHGVAYDRPVARTREVVDICRRVWARERVENNGIYRIPFAGGTGLGKPLKLITTPLRSRIPIYLAAIGSANVKMAAEIAEGWLPIFFWPEKYAEVWGEPIKAGKQERSGELGDLDIVAGGAVAIGASVGSVKEAVASTIALYVGGMGARSRNFYNELFCRYGNEDMAAEVQELYLSGRKAEAARRIPEEVISSLNLVGDAGHVKERLRAYEAVGVTTLMVQPAGPDPLGSFKILRSLVDGL